VLARIQAGCYLLVSNDGATLWRIAVYEEEGRRYWGAARQPMPSPELVLDEDWLWGSAWEHWTWELATRAQAVAEVEHTFADD
jgi:hypothetical protein